MGMLKPLNKVLALVDQTTARASKKFSLLLLVIMFFASFEVVARYVFNSPTNWVWPVNRQLFCLLALFGGIYTMSQRGHIRVELLYDRFPRRVKKIVTIFTVVSMILFLGVLIWQTTWMGWNSFQMKETNPGSFRLLPLYPIKMAVPILSFYFLLQGLSVYIRRNNHKNKSD